MVRSALAGFTTDGFGLESVPVCHREQVVGRVVQHTPVIQQGPAEQ